MLFSSVEFIFIFLPFTVAIYFIFPLKQRNLWLFAASLLFYGFGEPIYLFLMLLTITADYFFGLLIEKSKVRKRLWLTVGIIFNISLLAFFKYFDMLMGIFGFSSLGISLPIGISFYIFQATSYIIDVYRKEVEASHSLINFGAYVSLFPQLIAGPIVKYRDIDKELTERHHRISDIAKGISLFCVGLAKKALLANPAGELYESIIESKTDPASLWLGLILFAFQIYYDFSGYSDMAIGLGKVFGFTFPKNFDYPYVSKSITEFWRRWHMTLSSWFREYVYIPLGGNRRGKLRTYINLFAVWSLTGLWHGASWNFLIWGIYFFVLLVIEKAFLLKLLEKAPKAIGHIYALFFILLGWLIFSADGGVGEILTLSKNLFGMSGSPVFGNAFAYDLTRNLPFIAIMAIGATPLPKRIAERFSQKTPRVSLAARNILCLASIILSTAYIVSADYNPFLYFRF
ncbi:MAG: MBOAT family protein [Ruminococcaceae bacterium]|nr:MBOAT family protein [Oscillospiraceae bacterium]